LHACLILLPQMPIRSNLNVTDYGKGSRMQPQALLTQC